MTTPADIAADVALEFGEEYTDVDTKTLMDNWAIEAYNTIVRSARWFFQNDSQDITVVASQSTYDLDSDVAEVKTVWDPTNNQPITYAEVENLIARGKDLGSEGTPEHFYITGLGSSQELQIAFWPVPSSAYQAAVTTLKAYTLLRPVSMAATTTIDMPPEYVEIMRNYVRAHHKLSDGNTEAYLQLKEQFNQDLIILNARFSGKQRTGSTLPANTKHRVVSQSPGSLGSA